MSRQPQSRALIVDSDMNRAERFASILQFIDCESDVLCQPAALGNHDGLERYEVVFMANHPAAVDLVKGIKDAQEDAPAFVLLIDDEPTNNEMSNLAMLFMGLIRYDARYPVISNLLHKAEIFAKKRKSDGKAKKGSGNIELFRSLVGNSRSVRGVRDMIDKVAPSDATVLILGESGTGKEVVARNIHYYSKRRNKPFVPINCGAIPPDLLESELFGHEKGAFTGAIASRQGRFEMAEGGTIFLDEIGDMPLPMQVKLLRVLQERCFERVGSSKTIETDVRIVAATHQNLEKQIDKGKFREDLFYRLNVVPIEMPRLKDRLEDLPLLVQELITRLEHEKNISVKLTNAALVAMCNYDWPGNVRELANMIERLSVLFPYAVVDAPDLPEKLLEAGGNLPDQDEKVIAESVVPDVPTVEAAEGSLVGSIPSYTSTASPRLPRDGIDLKQHLTDIETSLIQQALDEAGGVVAHAAKRLKIRRTTLVEKMRKYNIMRMETESAS